MTTLRAVEFQLAPKERDQLAIWLKDHGAALARNNKNFYETATTYEEPPKNPYTAILPADFRLSAPDWILQLIAKP